MSCVTVLIHGPHTSIEEIWLSKHYPYHSSSPELIVILLHLCHRHQSIIRYNKLRRDPIMNIQYSLRYAQETPPSSRFVDSKKNFEGNISIFAIRTVSADCKRWHYTVGSWDGTYANKRIETYFSNLAIHVNVVVYNIANLSLFNQY